MKLLQELTEAAKKKEIKGLVKTILTYTDSNRNQYWLHIGENNGKFFVTLKGKSADFSLANVMGNTKGGTAARSKKLMDAIKKTWDGVRDKGPNSRGLTLRTTVNDVSDPTWKVEK